MGTCISAPKAPRQCLPGTRFIGEVKLRPSELERLQDLKKRELFDMLYQEKAAKGIKLEIEKSPLFCRRQQQIIKLN
jgi:hypothetical protein